MYYSSEATFHKAQKSYLFPITFILLNKHNYAGILCTVRWCDMGFLRKEPTAPRWQNNFLLTPNANSSLSKRRKQAAVSEKLIWHYRGSLHLWKKSTTTYLATYYYLSLGCCLSKPGGSRPLVFSVANCHLAAHLVKPSPCVPFISEKSWYDTEQSKALL